MKRILTHLLFIAAFIDSATACTWEIEVRNAYSGEVKRYTPSRKDLINFKFPHSNLQGICIVFPLKSQTKKDLELESFDILCVDPYKSVVGTRAMQIVGELSSPAILTFYERNADMKVTSTVIAKCNQ